MHRELQRLGGLAELGKPKSWQGSAGDRRPYADLTGNAELIREPYTASSRGLETGFRHEQSDGFALLVAFGVNNGYFSWEISPFQKLFASPRRVDPYGRSCDLPVETFAPRGATLAFILPPASSRDFRGLRAPRLLDRRALRAEKTLLLFETAIHGLEPPVGVGSRRAAAGDSAPS